MEARHLWWNRNKYKDCIQMHFSLFTIKSTKMQGQTIDRIKKGLAYAMHIFFLFFFFLKPNGKIKVVEAFKMYVTESIHMVLPGIIYSLSFSRNFFLLFLKLFVILGFVALPSSAIEVLEYRMTCVFFSRSGLFLWILYFVWSLKLSFNFFSGSQFTMFSINITL